jgi:isocitrate dehydrogenase
MYWARALADQQKEPALAAAFAPVAAQLERSESAILGELNGVQGRPIQIGGYYHPDPALMASAMRPSATLNAVIDGLRGT